METEAFRQESPLVPGVPRRAQPNARLLPQRRDPEQVTKLARCSLFGESRSQNQVFHSVPK